MQEFIFRNTYSELASVQVLARKHLPPRTRYPPEDPELIQKVVPTTAGDA